MKTSEKYVVAQIETNGRVTERKFYIRGKDGVLMTHRLHRLLEGRVQHYYDEEHRETVYFHFVGMVWRPPYTILHEVLQDRLFRQTKLAGIVANYPLSTAVELDGMLSELPTIIPERAPNDEISSAIRHELDLRHRLGIKIKEIKNLRGSRVPIPYTSDFDNDSGGWLIH